jgi:hypothetical protein
MLANIEIYGNNRKLKINVNAAWVSCIVDNTVLFKREPINENWYDEKHAKIMKALNELEDALLNAVKETE